MIVRRATQDDVGAIVDLVNEVFGLNRDLEWFSHFHFKNPNGDSILWVAQDDNGDIVSYRSIVRFKAHYLDRLIEGGQLADACTRPDCRGRGIYGKVNAETLKDFFGSGGDMAYAFPSPSNYQILARRFGFHTVAEIRQGFCPLAAYPTSSAAESLAKCVHSLVFRTSISENPSITIVPTSEGLDTVTFPPVEGGRVAFDRSRGFLEWRTSMPGRRYWIALMDEQNYAIIGEAHRRGLRVCTITDMRCANRFAKRELLNGIQSWAGMRHYQGLYTWPNHDWQTYLGAGFVPAPRRTPLLVRFNEESSLREKLFRWKEWDIRLLDTDAY